MRQYDLLYRYILLVIIPKKFTHIWYYEAKNVTLPTNELR